MIESFEIQGYNEIDCEWVHWESGFKDKDAAVSRIRQDRAVWPQTNLRLIRKTIEVVHVADEPEQKQDK